MQRKQGSPHKYSLTAAAAATAGGIGFAAALVAGAAYAASFTLNVAQNATVKGASAPEAIVVTKAGMAVYELTGDTRHHPECTKANGCFNFWPPVTVSASAKLSLPAGVKGKLGTWSRRGITQLTLSGHPLYLFTADTKRDDATGQGIKGFGGTWHVITVATASGTGPSTGSTPTGGGTGTGPTYYPPSGATTTSTTTTSSPTTSTSSPTTSTPNPTTTTTQPTTTNPPPWG